MTLADRIEKRIAKIPVDNPSIISLYPTTLRDTLNADLLRLIAKEAAAEIERYKGEGLK